MESWYHPVSLSHIAVLNKYYRTLHEIGTSLHDLSDYFLP